MKSCVTAATASASELTRTTEVGMVLDRHPGATDDDRRGRTPSRESPPLLPAAERSARSSKQACRGRDGIAPCSPDWQTCSLSTRRTRR